MFAENERRFGVTATFEESMYTTGLDGAKISAEEAERIAQSILSQQGKTAHEREERGQLDDSGLTEEDKYGAVLRQPGGRQGPHPPAGPPAGPPPGPPPAEDVAGRSSTAMPQGAAAGSDGNGNAPSERQEINAVRLKLAEGKNLQTAVDPQLRTKYTHDASAVDALNLMPGTGSHRYKKNTNTGVTNRFNAFKDKRLTNANTGQPGMPKPVPPPPVPAAAAPSDAPPAGGDPAPAQPRPPTPPAAPPAATSSGAPSTDGKPSTTMKFNPDATPFSFNPKSAPFTPGKKTQDTPQGSSDGGGGSWGGRKQWSRERGDGCASRQACLLSPCQRHRCHLAAAHVCSCWRICDVWSVALHYASGTYLPITLSRRPHGMPHPYGYDIAFLR